MVAMCRSGGLGKVAIISKSCNVQSVIGACCRVVLHVSTDGLIVTIRA